VDEHVLAAFIGCDKAVALADVEPLHGTYSHLVPRKYLTLPGKAPGTKSEESGFRTGTEPTEIEAFTPEVDSAI
jgi:hypothetical protein